MVAPRGLGSSTASSEYAIANRLAKLEEIVDLSDKTVLDIGCNDGAYTVELAQSARFIVGIDLEAKRTGRALCTAIERQATNIGLLTMNVEDLGFCDNSFDVLFINEVLEHIPDQDQALDEIHRVLRPGGCFILFAPNRFYPFETHGAHIGSRKFGRFVPLVHWLPRRIGRHLLNARSYTPSGLMRLLARHGLVVTHQSCLFPPFDGLRRGLERYHLGFLVDSYRKLIPVISKIPGLRSMGLSVFMVAEAV